jgi:magnesium chelatase family protein
MASTEIGESSEVVRQRVISAREVSSERFAGSAWNLNSQIPPRELRTRFKAEKSAMALLHIELDAERLSARGFHKVLRLAWSVADNRGHAIPIKDDVEMALQLRQGMETFQ